MNIEDIYNYCLTFPTSEDCMPFDDVTLVFKVMGKVFALIPTDAVRLSVALKCDPDYAIELRDRYPNNVEGAFHMNKKYWNTVYVDGEMTPDVVCQLIRHSVDEVIRKLPKYKQQEYASMQH